MGVRVVVDSSCDLPSDVTAELGITVVPLTVCFGDVEVLDGTDLSTEEFWRRMPSAPGPPRTAAPPPGRFASAFLRLAEEGTSGIVCLCLARELSGTLASARLGAEEVADAVPVEVVDSRSVTLGLGLNAVLSAAAARQLTLAEVATRAREIADRTWVWAVLDDLTPLRRGGRFTAPTGTVSVRSILEIRHGTLSEVGRVRTRGQAIRRLATHAAAFETIDAVGVAAATATCPPDLVAAVADLGPLTLGRIGPVVGSHTGPGTVGVAVVGS